MLEGFVRCGHCHGFYDAASAQCRYCGKDVPLMKAGGRPQIFPDRETCRAVQVAEYEQLPPEAHEDPFGPDAEMLDQMCYCLHCGEAGGLYEAVEMRWMVNEQLWACPCTTCGGRGFLVDVHLVADLYEDDDEEEEYDEYEEDEVEEMEEEEAFEIVEEWTPDVQEWVPEGIECDGYERLERMPDDIEFPRPAPPNREKNELAGEDDIPF